MAKNKKLKSAGRLAGFTLIELMVVVAIIGILMAIITTFITSARNRAYDTASIRNLNDLRTYANLYYLSHSSSYEGFFEVDTINDRYADDQVHAYMTNEGQYFDRQGGTDDASKWYAYAPLRNKPGQIYCVDFNFVGVTVAEDTSNQIAESFSCQ